MRAEIFVHNSRNWDFTKIPNNMREREKKKSLHQHATSFFRQKHKTNQPLQKVFSWQEYFYNPFFLAMGVEGKAATERCNVRGILVCCGSSGQEGREASTCNLHSWRLPGLTLPGQAEEEGLSFELNKENLAPGRSGRKQESFEEPSLTLNTWF